MPQAQLRSLFSAYYSKVFCHLEMRLKEKTIIKLFFRIQPNSTIRTTFWREKWINETHRQSVELHTLQRYVIQHPQHVQNVPTLLGAHDDQNSWGEKGEKEREMKDNFSGPQRAVLEEQDVASRLFSTSEYHSARRNIRGYFRIQPKFVLNFVLVLPRCLFRKPWRETFIMSFSIG